MQVSDPGQKKWHRLHGNKTIAGTEGMLAATNTNNILLLLQSALRSRSLSTWLMCPAWAQQYRTRLHRRSSGVAFVRKFAIRTLAAIA